MSVRSPALRERPAPAGARTKVGRRDLSGDASGGKLASYIARERAGNNAQNLANAVLFHWKRRLRWTYAKALYKDPNATLDDLREVVATLEDTLRTARRVLGGAHPAAGAIESCLEESRAALRARNTPGNA